MSLLEEGIPYPEEVERFRLEAHRDRFRVAALGDSVTLCARQQKGDRWPDLLETLIGPSCSVVNAGIGGTSSNLGLFRWHRDIAPIEPNCVIICFVLNDSHIRFYECRSSYLVQCSVDRMEANLQSMADLARFVGAVPVFWTPPPVPPWPEGFKNLLVMELQLELLEQYVAIVERVARDREIPLVDLWHTFPRLVDEYPGKYFNPPDGYHSNDASQPLIARQIADRVLPVFEAWQNGK